MNKFPKILRPLFPAHRPRTFQPPAFAGFTLVELVAALAVIAIVLAVGMPAMAGIRDSSQLSSTTNDFFSSLYLARSEAIKRNSRGTMCKSADGEVCTNTGAWEQGWIVFHDVNNNADRDADETLIQRADPLPDGWHVSGNLNVSRYISYSPTGKTHLVSGAFQAGTITLCKESAGATNARQIIINAAGRVRVYKTTVSSCY